MMYKNSFKVLFSNASLIWKILLYFILCTLIVGGLTIVCALPIINVLGKEGIWIQLTDLIKNFYSNLNFSDLLLNTREWLSAFMEVIATHMDSLLIYIIMFFIILFVFGSFMYGLCEVACGGVLYNAMSNNIRQGFSNSFVSNIKKSVKLQLAKLTIVFPVNVGIAVTLFYTFGLVFYGGLVGIFSPFIIILVYIILSALKNAIFSSWMPNLFVSDYSVYRSFTNGFAIMSRRFLNILGGNIAVFISVVFLNVFVGVFTFGVAIIVTVPASVVFLMVFNMVAFYSSKGMRFYTDTKTVFEPIKMEATDNIKKIKYIL